MSDTTLPRMDQARTELLATAILNGETDLAALNGLTEEELEGLYAMGYGFYTAGQQVDALDVFKFLCLHRHTEPRFWLGLGAVSQVTGQYNVALQAYGVCAMLRPDDPQVSLRAAECFLAVGNRASAGTALEAVIELAVGNPEAAHWARRAQVLQENLPRAEV